MPHPKRIVAALLLAALWLPGCHLDLADEATPTVQETPGIDFRVCQVTDAAGISDHSHNQAVDRGVKRAMMFLGVATNYRETAGPEDLKKVVETFALRGCDLIVVPDTAGDVKQAVAAEPDLMFAIVDIDSSSLRHRGDVIQAGNAIEITFQAEEAAYLAGYVAAGTSRSRTIGTLGGERNRETIGLMNAFAEGARAFGAAHGQKITVLGAPQGKASGTLTGSDENPLLVQSATASLVRDGADVVYPVAGAASAGAVIAAELAGDVALVWPGENGCRSLPESCSLFLTSVVSNTDNAVYDVIKLAVGERFEGGAYLGSLGNGGVGISPYHSHKGDVSPELRREVAELRDSIIAGRNDYFTTAN